jgi:26S proteasome regulatory subunit N1
MSAIFALGLIGAGTNNSRIAGNLRYLASYYANNPDQIYVVRLSQGLVHMGKVRLLKPFKNIYLYISLIGSVGT